jgi:hypothetical protein
VFGLDQRSDVVVEPRSQFLDRLREVIGCSHTPIVDRLEKLAFLLGREIHGCERSDGFETVADGTAAFQVRDFVEQEIAGGPANLDGLSAGQGNPDAVDPALHSGDST